MDLEQDSDPVSDQHSDQDSDQETEQDSDQDSNQESEYDWGAFAVVRANVNFKDRYDCIPSSWIVPDDEFGRAYRTTVTYLFPSSDKLGKGVKFNKNQPPNANWPDYLGKMLFDTNSRAKAFRFIKHEKERVRRLAREMGETTSESDSAEEAPPKRSGTKRKQSEQENKHQDNQNIQNQTKKNAKELDKNNESEKVEAKKQLHSHCYKFYVEYNASYQKSMSILDNTVNYLQNIVSTYKTTAAAKAKMSSPLRTKQKHDDETTNDSKWTLRYPEQDQGIIELMPNTGVYVSTIGLSECKIKYVKFTEFTKGVLEQVFTEEAIRSCSFTGQPPKRQGSENLPTRPGLDLVARETLVSYIEQYGSDKGWWSEKNQKNPTKIIANCIRNKLSEAYQKSKLTPKTKPGGRDIDAQPNTMDSVCDFE